MLRPTTASILSRFTKQQLRHYEPSPKSPKHTTRKTHELDVQSLASKQAMRERQAARGGSPQGIKKDPKEGHPEAPEPVIGMQDERGHANAS